MCRKRDKYKSMYDSNVLAGPLSNTSGQPSREEGMGKGGGRGRGRGDDHWLMSHTNREGGRIRVREGGSRGGRKKG